MRKNIAGVLLLLVFLIAPIFGQAPKKFIINPFTGQPDYYNDSSAVATLGAVGDVTFTLTATGDLIHRDAASKWVNLAIGTGGKYLRSTGTLPAWSSLLDADLPAALTGKSYNGVTPTALATGFSLAGGTTSKSLTVELDSLVNQDLTTDASPTFAGLTLTGLSGFVSASAGVLSADTQLAWSGGILTAQTSNGTNTDTNLTLKGKGTGDGVITLYGGGSSVYHVIQASDTGTAANNTLRIGLDPGSHTLILCDLPDINDVSLPIYLPNAAPTLRIWDAVINTYTDYSAGYIRTGFGAFTIQASSSFAFDLTADLPSGNAYWFDYTDLGFNKQLTDTDGRQKWMNINANPNQSGTAAFDLIYGNAVLTGLGTGATGNGNNLLNLSVSAVPKFKVDVAGSVTAGQTSVSLADNAVHDTGITAFYGQLIVKDTTTGVTGIFRLDGGATPVIISAHTNFSTTQGTDVKINVYFSTTYKIENCNTAASVVKCAFIGVL